MNQQYSNLSPAQHAVQRRADEFNEDEGRFNKNEKLQRRLLKVSCVRRKVRPLIK